MAIQPNHIKRTKQQEQAFIDLSRLDGGLNIWELDYRLKNNQSPNMLNMYWLDGALSSRRGQARMYPTALGIVHAAYKRLYNEYGVFHAGTTLYKFNLTTGVTTALLAGLPTIGGNFFVFNDKLYYKTVGAYVQITPAFVATNVVGFVPVIAMNVTPAGLGTDLYQPENRISKWKTVWYTADGTSTVYKLLLTGCDANTPTIYVNGVLVTTGFTFDAALGTVTFTTAPTQTNPSTPNNVKITFAKTDATATSSIMDCPFATIYGGDNDICVVMGGGATQSNAYYWSGVNLVADPSYFPADYYNLAGQTDESITGFGKHQALLIIFKEHSVGKAGFALATIAGRDYVSMPYTNINIALGCDLPKTIQLVQNNLVFANTYGGVFILRDTSPANENSITSLSKNINGDAGENGRQGLLYHTRKVAASAVSSIDDNTRYWIVANGHAYVWDYTLSAFIDDESSLSWFHFDNIGARAWIKTIDAIFYGGIDGHWTKFITPYEDYGLAITRTYEFAVQNLGTFERLKDVDKVIFVTRTDENTLIEIEYVTDYGRRTDPQQIISFSYKLSPRNLRFRNLEVVRFAKANLRRPRALHVRHFTMMLSNKVLGSGMSLVSAQIFYRYAGVDR